MQDQAQSAAASTLLPEREFRYHPKSLAIFAIRTSVVIATVLSIPDAVALIPGATTFTAWVFKLVSCWITAVVAWFVFCLGALHALRLVAGGVRVSDRGIKLWRFGKLLSWDDILSITLESEQVFTRVFSFDRTIKRLSIFSRVTRGPKAFRKLLVPHYVPSYFFQDDDFRILVNCLTTKKFSLEPDLNDCLIVAPAHRSSLQSTYSLLKYQRMAVSVLIAVGVLLFLGRRAGVLYTYNQGLHQFRLHNYIAAERYFSVASSIDPTFAPALHGLAGAEFCLGDFGHARDNWEKALKWKPDYVEAKVSLAYLSVQQRQFDRARDLLEHALRLAPNDSSALLNQADLDLRTGHINLAIREARRVLSEESGEKNRDTFMARCLLAHAKLLAGKPRDAYKIIAELPSTKEHLRSGENLTYRLIVGARTYLALGMLSKAERMARMAMHRAANVDTMLTMADVRIKLGDEHMARSLLKRCQEMMPHNPWIYLYASRLNRLAGKSELAEQNLDAASQCQPSDSLSMTEIAQEFLLMGRDKKALAAARMALFLVPDNTRATTLIEKLDPK